MNVLYPHTVDLSTAQLRVVLLDLHEWATMVSGVETSVPAVVSTYVPHGLSVGDTILLTGCRDIAGVNDAHTVTAVPSETTFVIDNDHVSGRYAGGGLAMKIQPTVIEDMPWMAYVGHTDLVNVRYTNGVLDADNCRVVTEMERFCDAVALFGRNGNERFQMIALMVDGINLQFVTNGQPTHVMWANTPERILSDLLVSSPVLFQQPIVERSFPGETHLYARDLERKTVLLDGHVLQDVVEVKRFKDGQGYALSLLDAAGNSKRWIDGQFKLNIFRGGIEIREAL